ncbi:MAG: Eco57I restriction-modification methylase domain-containing protein [Candidatus Rifleibacteriota bacterium]
MAKKKYITDRGLEKTETGLFQWFRQTLEKNLEQELPARPADILHLLHAPEFLLDWVSEVEDGIFPVKQNEVEQLPDLESRIRNARRKTGQYYTPESFARKLILETGQNLNGKILDPACGDGSFLVATAEELSTRPDCAEWLSAIHGYDVDSQALLICLGRMLGRFWGNGWPRLLCKDFLRADDKTRFSLIIGNPPYKVNLNEELKVFLRSRYKTSEGEKDLYTFFIERSCEMLEPGGNLILLTSHTWLVNHQCRLIRKLVFNLRVMNIFLLPARFFVSAPGVLPAVLHLRNRQALTSDETVLHVNYNPERGWNNNFQVKQEILESGRGLRQAIVPEKLKNIFEVMVQSSKPLGEICRVGVGIQESLKREGVVSKFVTDQCLSSRHRKVLKGRELFPFQINWEGKFIDYGPHLAYAGDEQVFSGEKVLYQNIRNEKLKFRLVAAHDRRGFFPKNSISFITGGNSKNFLPYLSGLLNSLLVNAWFSGHYHSFHITVSQVRAIPLPDPEPILQNKIAALADRISMLKFESGEYKEAWQELNLLVCEAYLGIGQHQQLLDECDFFLEQAATL